MRYSASRKAEIIYTWTSAPDDAAKEAILAAHLISPEEFGQWLSAHAQRGVKGLRCKAMLWKNGYVRKRAA